MTCVLKMMNFALKLMNFALKLMTFAGELRGQGLWKRRAAAMPLGLRGLRGEHRRRDSGE